MIWLLIFIFSLVVLIKSADWLILSAEKIGLALGLSSFTVGLIIVSLGTSLPELASSITATLKGMTDFAVSNAIGSNIANILLVIGASAVIGKKLIITKSLIDLDLPLLTAATVLLLGIASDAKIVFLESILLLSAYLIYVFYTISSKEPSINKENLNLLPSREIRRRHIFLIERHKNKKLKITLKDIVLLFIGVIGLTLASKYLVDSVINLSKIFNITPGIIAITAVAIGTSLPELFVSIRAVLQKRSEMALGNILGSNVFNALVVVGLPGLFTTLELDEKTFSVGLPIMALATFCFIVSGISRKIHKWEGGFYLILFLFFIGKIFNLI
ncbi:MAG: calcium/sodium antiporter [Candidatus Pacebacteria bacterium]|nr:calcium/sodium antiporter [Candidatus Paceibacterota bacterium]